MSLKRSLGALKRRDSEYDRGVKIAQEILQEYEKERVRHSFWGILVAFLKMIVQLPLCAVMVIFCLAILKSLNEVIPVLPIVKWILIIVGVILALGFIKSLLKED